jgi:hypothetical protein
MSQSCGLVLKNSQAKEEPDNEEAGIAGHPGVARKNDRPAQNVDG